MDSPDVYFTGYFRDAETGFDYAMNRYHAPGTGRFLTVDPWLGSAHTSNPSTWNRYAYTTGDPINHVDRTGRVECDDWDEDTGECYGDEGPGDYGNDPTDCNGDYTACVYGDGMTPVEYCSLRPNDPQCVSGGDQTGKKSSPTSGSITSAGKTAINLLTKAFQSSDFSNCDKVFGGIGSLADKVMGFVQGMTFMDGRLPGSMGAAGAPTSQTFAQYSAAVPVADATVLNNANVVPSSTVVLWGNFFNEGAFDQEVTLIHEFMHSFYQTADHGQLAAKFGISPGNDASAAIDSWIAKDCGAKK
jgi:RHS repeat-associated protein